RPRGCERLHRFLIEFRPAGLEQVAEANARQPVTRGTNLLVDLKAALKLRGIVLSGKPAETPALAFNVDGIAGRERRRGGDSSAESRERYEKKSVLCRLHRLSPLSAFPGPPRRPQARRLHSFSAPTRR